MWEPTIQRGGGTASAHRAKQPNMGMPFSQSSTASRAADVGQLEPAFKALRELCPMSARSPQISAPPQTHLTEGGDRHRAIHFNLCDAKGQECGELASGGRRGGWATSPDISSPTRRTRTPP